MKHRIFIAFRSLAKIFSGSGLRARYPFINAVYKRFNHLLSPKSVDIFGNKIFIDMDDSMGLAVNGIYEPLETKIVFEHVRPGQVVLDVGANIGYYTLLFAKLVGPVGKVYAYEPEPNSFALLAHNVNINHYKNVHVSQKAASNFNGSIKLRLDNFNNLDHRIIASENSRLELSVDTIRLEDDLPSDLLLDFIKLDIQGSEGLALDGMAAILDRSKSAKILTEFWPKGLDASGTGADNYLRKLQSFGYSFYNIGQDLQSVEKQSISQLLELYLKRPNQHMNLLCVRD